MANDGERIATNEQAIRDIRGDIADLISETNRTRKRLHDLEGIASVMVAQEKQRNRDTQRSQRRFELRLQVLTVVVAFAALAEPFLYHVAVGG